MSGDLHSFLPEKVLDSKNSPKLLLMDPQGTSHPKKYDVFLSHSGAQKNFLRHLHRDLTREGMSCFFDEDPQSLPKGEKFPPRIFEAAERCRIAVVVVSMEFIHSRWPMLELATFVKARNSDKNPNLKILPIFFKISPGAVSRMAKDNQKWKELEESEKTRGEWRDALTEICPINAFLFSEGENEVSFIDKIVSAIRGLLFPTSPRYFVSFMQGQPRMCQEVENFFENASSDKNGIHIAGLYGLPGSGKTTVGMAFCNFKLYKFEGKVCHVELQREKSVETVKHVLQHLAHSSETLLNSITTKYAAQEMLTKQTRGLRVLLVLDNITEDPEILDDVRFYLSAGFASGSLILLTARSLKILEKLLPAKSCMHVPKLTEEEAIGILLERTSVRERALGAEDTAIALKCAKRCWFKEAPAGNGMVEGAMEFHPLALKAFGSYLFTKFGCDMSRWNSELSDLQKPEARDLHDVLAVLDKVFLDFSFKYQTIFILLSVYRPPKISSDKVYEWLAIICNLEIYDIHKAVEDLIQKAFVERFEPEVRIHSLLVEFAQNKASKMEKWLWVKGNAYSFRQLISEDHSGFELIKFEDCIDRKPFMVRKEYIRNLLSLQLVDMENLSEVDLSSMNNLRSIIIHNCEELQQIEGTELLSSLAWLQICRVKPSVKLPLLSRFLALKHLEIDIPNCAEPGSDGKSIRQEGNHSRIHIDLGDLTCCIFLKEICVRSPFLSEFPTVKGLPHLEKVEFIDCFDVTGPLDCTGCSQLQKIVFNFCCQMTHPPLLSGCSEISEIVLWQCDALTECPQIDRRSCLETLELCISSEARVGNPPIHLDSCFSLKNIQLWNIRKLRKLPKFNNLSSLTTLKLHHCGICKPPDLAGCPLLENVSFFTLKRLKRFPSFSGFSALKKLSLCNCKRVRSPPDISGCSQLQVFHLVYNDNMQGLPQMDNFHSLEEIKLSWHAQGQDKFIHMESDSDSEEDEYDDLEFCLSYWKDTTFDTRYINLPVSLIVSEWLQGKRILSRIYFRGGSIYYCITAPSSYGETHIDGGILIHERSLPEVSCSRWANQYVQEIRQMRRVDEIRWGRKLGYDFKLSEAELHGPVSQLFKRMGLWLSTWQKCQGVKEKVLWLQMWKEWEDKWSAGSGPLYLWEEWNIKCYWGAKWKIFTDAYGENERMKMERERCIEWNIKNYWDEKYEKVKEVMLDLFWKDIWACRWGNEWKQAREKEWVQAREKEWKLIWKKWKEVRRKKWKKKLKQAQRKKNKEAQDESREEVRYKKWKKAWVEKWKPVWRKKWKQTQGKIWNQIREKKWKQEWEKAWKETWENKWEEMHGKKWKQAQDEKWDEAQRKKMEEAKEKKWKEAQGERWKEAHEKEWKQVQGIKWKQAREKKWDKVWETWGEKWKQAQKKKWEKTWNEKWDKTVEKTLNEKWEKAWNEKWEKAWKIKLEETRKGFVDRVQRSQEGNSKLIEWNIKNYWEEKWKEMTEAYGGNIWTKFAADKFIECDIRNYWGKKWKKRFIEAYGKRHGMEMERDRVIWEINFMNNISFLMKISNCDM